MAGKTLTLERPLGFMYSATYSPYAYVVSPDPVINAGVENIGLENSTNQGADTVKIENSAHCWLKGVDIHNVNLHGFMLDVGTCNNEVRFSAIRDAFAFGPGQAYGGLIYNLSCGNLVEDNCFHHVGFVFGSGGGSCNVLGYNNFETVESADSNWMLGVIDTHGAHTAFNLFEGNCLGKGGHDNTWGSASHHMWIRNYFNRLNPGVPVNNVVMCFYDCALNYYISLCGCVLGPDGMSGPVEQEPYTTITDNPITLQVGHSGHDTGYATDATCASTIIRHGNRLGATSSTEWQGAYSHSIPLSLYFSAKPSWFGSLAWPSIGPDIGGYVTDTPARKRWEAFKVSGNVVDLFTEQT